MPETNHGNNNHVIYCFDLSLATDLDSSASLMEREIAETKGEGKAKWLETFWFPTQRRKNPSLAFSLEGRSTICIKSTNRTEESGQDDDPSSEEELLWQKNVSNALKKIEVEDLGDMDAIALKESIPEEDDADGRGMRDLCKLEKQLSIKVVFCASNKHVLLVGQKSKLQKKCFVLRNMLSHYHWRLSGKDVSFGTMTRK